MNLRRLRTMVAIAEADSFTAAGDAVGLSHSAISLHVKELEAELGAALVDRSRRPPILTDRGAALVERARAMLDIADEIKALGAEAALVGRLSVGFAPSTLSGLAPPALAALRREHPQVQLRIGSGLSDDLARRVRGGELDAALTTAPERPLEGVVARDAAREPLEAIAPPDAPPGDARALLEGRPFIWFSRKTWAGAQIERWLAAEQIAVDSAMEVDSVEAVEAMVRAGLGASIAPRRSGSDRIGMRTAPFGQPQRARMLALIERARNPRKRLCDALLLAVRRAADQPDSFSIE